ncbi:hypothetical protein B0H13DRAFT_2525785 [Mycena leptocephala]|nr:hypothetical protein B0H13DRAFT_2525785 [Mycena leptocephala]
MVQHWVPVPAEFADGRGNASEVGKAMLDINGRLGENFGARAEASESEEVEHTTHLFRVLKSVDKPETYVRLGETLSLGRLDSNISVTRPVGWGSAAGQRQDFQVMSVEFASIVVDCRLSPLSSRFLFVSSRLGWSPSAMPPTKTSSAAAPPPALACDHNSPKARTPPTQIQIHKDTTPTRINTSTRTRRCTTLIHMHTSLTRSSMHPNMAATQADRQYRAYGPQASALRTSLASPRARARARPTHAGSDTRAGISATPYACFPTIGPTCTESDYWWWGGPGINFDFESPTAVEGGGIGGGPGRRAG